MKTKRLLTLFLFLLFSSVQAQDQGKIDSLKKVIETAGHDTTKIKALLHWDDLIYISDPKLDLALNLRIMRLCETNLKKDITDTERFYFRGKLATSYHNIGAIYLVQSDYPRALDYNFKSLKLRDELGDKAGMASSYGNIGIMYKEQSDYSLALEYYFKDLAIQEELSNSSDKAMAESAKAGEGICYNNIAGVYFYQADYLTALDYTFKSLKIAEELGNKQEMAGAYTNISGLYTSLYGQSLSGGSSLEKLYGMSQGESGELTDKDPEWLLDTAMYYNLKAFAIDKEINDNYGMTYDLIGIAEIYSEKGAYSHALTYYQEAALLADSIRALNESSIIHKGLSETYEQLGEHKKSLDHYKQYSILKDSLFNGEKSKDIGKLEAKYEFEKAEEERKRFEKERVDLLTATQRRRDNLQYSGILIFIMLLFAGVFMLGRFSIPIRLAEGMVFFSFLLFFEFTLVLLDPYIEQFSSGAPAIKLGFNAVLAGLIFPLHSFFEEKMKGRLVKK